MISMINNKPFWLSKSIQGSATTIAGILVNVFHLPLVSDEINTLVAAIFVIAGLVYQVYGRIVTNGETLTVK